jgi:hypothetical protein
MGAEKPNRRDRVGHVIDQPTGARMRGKGCAAVREITSSWNNPAHHPRVGHAIVQSAKLLCWDIAVCRIWTQPQISARHACSPGSSPQQRRVCRFNHLHALPGMELDHPGIEADPRVVAWVLRAGFCDASASSRRAPQRGLSLARITCEAAAGVARPWPSWV